MPRSRAADAPSLGELTRYFLTLGTIGFGGPIALAGAMERDLIERRGWFSRDEYLEGLALAQLAPGPLAAQLAIYLGWLKGGIRGATLIGVAFVAPSFLIVLMLAAGYVRFGGLPWMQGAFYGVGAAVIAVICRSAWRLARLTQARDPVLWTAFGCNAVLTAWREQEFVWVFLLCGVAVTVARAAWRPRLAAAVLVPWPLVGHAVPGNHTMAPLAGVFWYFARAGAVVFGSGLAIVPFLYGGVVGQHHWLTERQFLDAIAVAMITPGPVVITVAFIGYLVAGPAGACAAAAGVFLPVYLFVVVPARWVRVWARDPRLTAFVAGVTAAATGAIAGAVVVLARRALVDGVTIAIAAVALSLVLLVRRVPEPLLMAGAGVAGLLLR